MIEDISNFRTDISQIKSDMKMRCCKFFLILLGPVLDCNTHTHNCETHFKTHSFRKLLFPDGPAVRCVGVGCQPLCVCKSLGNGSWMGAGSLFVCILQSFSLGRTSPLPLLVSLMPLCLLALPVFLSGTFSAAHAAVSILLKEEKSTRH